MANAYLPDELPIDANVEGPEDPGITPGGMTPEVPDVARQGDDIAQQVDEMEKRVLAQASPEVKEAVEDIQENENPGPNQEKDADENPDPERDEPA